MQKIIIILACLFLFGCSVHKIDIRQGNLVTQEMLDQLQLNMPARKVRFIMGTPLIVDVFHPQRWDYLYSFKAGQEVRKQRRVTLFFDESQHLIKVDGDVKIGASRPQTPLPEDLEPIL